MPVVKRKLKLDINNLKPLYKINTASGSKNHSFGTVARGKGKNFQISSPGKNMVAVQVNAGRFKVEVFGKNPLKRTKPLLNTCPSGWTPVWASKGGKRIKLIGCKKISESLTIDGHSISYGAFTKTPVD